jgi:DNA processing protein
MNEELLHRIALTMVPELGPVLARQLINRFGTARTVFKSTRTALAQTEGIGEFRAAQIKQFRDFAAAEKEMCTVASAGISVLFISDDAYPHRLRQCYDAPLLLYYKGSVALNQSRIISIVGTRRQSSYGKQITEQLITALAPYEVMIISGLALGIDATAHRQALQSGLPTIAVLAHGLNNIYPDQHRSLAAQIATQGGLLTELNWQEKPDRHHFPKRNRIVAGMADATLVMETEPRGGSMITADLAFQYNRDLFALPGRITDLKSSGCLQLIRDQKAVPLIDAAQLADSLGWNQPKTVTTPATQRHLFPELSAEEISIINLLATRGTATVDELYLASGLSNSRAAATLLSLEMQQLVRQLPGKQYQLIN